MKPEILQVMGLLFLLLPVSGNGVGLGTRQQTILPIEIPSGTPGLALLF